MLPCRTTVARACSGGMGSQGRHDRVCSGHPRPAARMRDVDARDKPAHDGDERGVESAPGITRPLKDCLAAGSVTIPVGQ
jgi:hypothetical protein